MESAKPQTEMSSASVPTKRKINKINVSEKELDCTNASRGVWLVKVPKYISSRWEKVNPMTEVGRLKITKGPAGKPDIIFTLTDELMKTKDVEDQTASIPKEHRFVISNIANQTLAVFSQPKDDAVDPHDPQSNRLFLEGTVVQKGECRPTGDANYMQLKKKSILLASQPTRLVKQLDKVVTNYKPVSDHKHNIEFEQKKKAEGKKSREDKEKVMDVLYAAFEKHQYYNIKDLEKITRQPIPYLKEILKEICNYNAKNPHKNMWELKPEYRHYKGDDAKS